VVAEADTAVVVAAVDTVVAAADMVVAEADMVVAEAVVAPVALVATAADIAKTLPTVLRMGVKSNLHPHFLFTNPILFFPQSFPTSPSAIKLSLLRAAQLPKIRIVISTLTCSGDSDSSDLFRILPPPIKKVRTFFFFTGQT
jgi:hypothetical protein